jgi:hypothetical protein
MLQKLIAAFARGKGQARGSGRGCRKRVRPDRISRFFWIDQDGMPGAGPFPKGASTHAARRT